MVTNLTILLLTFVAIWGVRQLETWMGTHKERRLLKIKERDADTEIILLEAQKEADIAKTRLALVELERERLRFPHRQARKIEYREIKEQKEE